MNIEARKELESQLKLKRALVQELREKMDYDILTLKELEGVIHDLERILE